jgi:hypothetical protein
MPTLDDLTQALKPQVVKAQAILKCCLKELCKREHPPLQTCALPELRSSIDPNPNESSTPQHVAAKAKGGLNIAQSFAEILMLEYAEFGLAGGGQNFGFGRAHKPDMLDILQIHTSAKPITMRLFAKVAKM